MKRIIILFLILTVSIFAYSLKISEFCVTPTGSEQVEIYNETGVSIDVNGYKIYVVGISSTNSTTFKTASLSAGGYKSFTMDTVNFVADIGLPNDGAIIKIYDASNILLDSVGYGDQGPAPAPIYNFSCARVADTGDNALDFNMDPTPTYGSANDAAGVLLGTGSVFINEIYAIDTSDNKEAVIEFIELYNNADTAVDLSNWILVCDDDYVIAGGSIIPAKGYFYAKDSLWFPTAGYFDLDGSRDNLYLYNNSYERIDQSGWDNVNVVGTSFSVYPNGIRNNYKGYSTATSTDFVKQGITPDATNGGTYLVGGTVGLADNPADSSGTIVTIRELAWVDTTDIQGHFNFIDVPENTYTFVFENILYNSDSLSVNLISDTSITITLSNTYTLSGIVGLNDDPTDSFGISVSLSDTVTPQNILTDSSGYYEFTNLTAGTYTLIITKQYYSQDSLDMAISSDTTYNTDLDRLLGTIWGTVGLDDNPADSSGSIVVIDGEGLADTTAADGSYLFNNLPYGYNYSLIYTHDTYQSNTGNIFLDTLSEALDITLVKLSGITDDTIEKVIIESDESGLSFTYNKTVDQPTTMYLYDLTGRNVMTEYIQGSRGVYKLSINKNLSKGVYFIKILGEEKPFLKKFIIMK